MPSLTSCSITREFCYNLSFSFVCLSSPISLSPSLSVQVKCWTVIWGIILACSSRKPQSTTNCSKSSETTCTCEPFHVRHKQIFMSQLSCDRKPRQQCSHDIFANNPSYLFFILCFLLFFGPQITLQIWVSGSEKDFVAVVALQPDLMGILYIFL